MASPWFQGAVAGATRELQQEERKASLQVDDVHAGLLFICSREWKENKDDCVYVCERDKIYCLT